MSNMIIRYDLYDRVKIKSNCMDWFRKIGYSCTQSGTIVKVQYNTEREMHDHLFQCSCGNKHTQWVDCDEITLDEDPPDYYKEFKEKIEDRLK